MDHRCRFAVLKTENREAKCKFQVEVDCTDIHDGYQKGLAILEPLSAGEGFSWMRELVQWVKEVQRHEPWFEYTKDTGVGRITLVVTYL